METISTQTANTNPPVYGRFRAIYLSLYRKALYQDVWHRWAGLGFTYLLLLNFIIVVPVMAFGVIAFDKAMFDEKDSVHIMFAEAIDDFIGQIPPITWEDGQMKTKVDQPYVMTLNLAGERVDAVIIDRKGHIDDLKKSDAWMLMTKDAVHMKKDDSKIESRFWGDFEKEQFALNKDIAQELAEQTKQWFVDNRLTLYAFFVLGVGAMLIGALLLYRLVQALIYGLVGLAIGSMFKAPLRYDAAVRIACVAMTPAILIDIVLLLVGAGGISMLMSMVVTTGYLTFAIMSQRQTNA